MKPLTFGSFCSGIGAPEMAWSELGWRPQFFSEIEPFPCAALAHHYPDVPNLGDMEAISAETIRRFSADALVAGTPCQSFSVAGLRKGMADPRGNLALVFLRLVDWLRPRWLVWENVPGVLSSWSDETPGETGERWQSNDFDTFLSGLRELGYGVAWRILDAQFFGVPQRRRRVFVVGYLGDWRRAAAVLFERHSVSGNPPPRRETGQRIAAGLTRGADSSGKGGYAGRRREDDTNIIAGCLNSGGNAGGFRTEPGEHLVPADMPVARPLLGKSNVSHDASKDSLIIAHSLRADGFDASEDGTGRGTPIIASPITAGYAKGVGVNDGKRGSPQNLIRKGEAVRRLTPRECERLQGFPDNFTAIPFRGKLAADGPRYRSLGNSMAVPVLKWIGERIEMVEEAANA